jgi:nicotinamidase-related amidase
LVTLRIVPELTAQVSGATAVVDKHIYSLFTSHGRELVRRHGWTDLYVCGIATESYVLKTAADAFEQGDLTPWIIEDASASHAGPAAHSAGIMVAAGSSAPTRSSASQISPRTSFRPSAPSDRRTSLPQFDASQP